MTGFEVIAVPYDSGFPRQRMGNGPEYLLRHGVAERLGADVRTSVVELDDEFAPEVRSANLLHIEVARRVRAAEGRIPVLLAGNCNTTLGVVAGLGGDVGVVWFDAHGDFNTPETSGGFLDGMALSMVTGACWRTMCATVPGFRPVPESHVVLAGARDLDPGERVLIEESDLRLVAPDDVHAAGMARALGELPVSRIHLHIDLDVHDRDTVGAANGYAAGGGPSAERVREAVTAVADAFEITSVTFSAYDPSADTGGGIRDAALALAELISSRIGLPVN